MYIGHALLLVYTVIFCSDGFQPCFKEKRFWWNISSSRRRFDACWGKVVKLFWVENTTHQTIFTIYNVIPTVQIVCTRRETASYMWRNLEIVDIFIKNSIKQSSPTRQNVGASLHTGEREWVKSNTAHRVHHNAQKSAGSKLRQGALVAI